MKISGKKYVLELILPTFGLILISLLIIENQLDIKIASAFYDFNQSQWYLKNQHPWKWLYHYGNWPGLSIAIVSLILFLISFFKNRLKMYRFILLFLSLTMIIGPGLIVNSLFKQNWGRPRPRNIILFGGKKEFKEFYQKPFQGKGNSFPSGHAATAFYLITPYFIFRNRYKKTAFTFLIFGTSYGSFMGVCRIVQGAHFFSDVVYSAFIVYFTDWFLWELLKKKVYFKTED